MTAVLPEQHHRCRKVSIGKKIRNEFLTTLSDVHGRNPLYIHPVRSCFSPSLPEILVLTK